MSNTDLVVRTQRPAVTGMASVGVAFKRALVSQCHPKMLAALFLPFVIALLGAIILLWAFWTPLTGWLNTEASSWAVVDQVDQWMLAIGLFSIKLYLIPMLAVVILLPISGILGLVIAALFVMPIVLRHLEKREYQGLSRQGQYSTAV
ncbi:MAG TPA: EI24 domain-containing protein, partial [Candidimonas sp.]|nr:EI24 domain-containing protein [Candidimonas sp.]